MVAAALCPGQAITSAQSGTLHYFDGDVAIDGAAVQPQTSRFPAVKEQSVLSTRQGRAEVLLTPGVFLRIGENSSVKMLDNRLISTRVEVLSGNAIVESDDPQMSIKDSPVSIIYKDYEVRLVKHGLFEIGADDAALKVFKGEAVVTVINGEATDRATVREGRMLHFSVALLTENFDQKTGDDLYLWARDRSQSISAANMTSAHSLDPNSGGYGFGGYGFGGYANSGYGYGAYDPLYGGYGSGYGAWNGGWYFNPFLNMFTFVPASGAYWNAFGYGFFSPGMINAFYSPSNYWYGGGGARGNGSIGHPLDEIHNGSSPHLASISSLLPHNSGVGSPAASAGVLGSPGMGTASLRSSGVGSSGGFSGHASSFGGGGGHGGGHR